MQAIAEAFAKVGDLGFYLGVRDISKLDHCWEHQVDEQWWFAVNATHQVQVVRGMEVPYGHVYVEYNGWPAGVFSPSGQGVIAAGEGANEGTLIAALDAAIERAKVRT